MREAEIRDRLHDAIGETRYPAALSGKVEARLGHPAPRTYPPALGLVAAILALLIVASLVYIRIQSPARPATAPSASPTAYPYSPVPAADVPSFDLAAADLTPAATLVSQEDLVATSGGRTVRLVAAYADPARTVLILRTFPAAGVPIVKVSDGKGPIDAVARGADGVAGDQIVDLDQAPHAGSDGMAHLNVTVTGFAQDPGPQVSGTWDFAFAIPIQPASSLPFQPALTSVGSWKVTVEAFDLTPSVIHLRARFDGASTADVVSGVHLLDASGAEIHAARLPNPVANGPGNRFDWTWPRPVDAATYHFQIVSGEAQYRTDIAIQAAPPLVSGKGAKGHPLGPTDFPAASQSLTLQGVMTDHIATGHPQSCGAGFGPSGAIFAFATYFESRGSWYYMSFYTDPAVEQYHGPGTYKARATLGPNSLLGGTSPMFTGTPQLTVTSDSGLFALHQGSVTGTLGWTDDTSQTVTISGTWTCKPGQELGPA